MVFNLEVETDHHYLVGHEEVLVHNNGCMEPEGKPRRTVHEDPDATTLSQEELDYYHLNESDYRAYRHQFEEGAYIGEGVESRPEMSAGGISSLHQDRLISTDEFPVPTKLDSQRFESQMMKEVDAVNNPEYYNKRPQNDPLR